MSADNDRFGPTWHKFRQSLENNRLTENGAIENVTDGTVRGLPHLLELEFYYIVHALIITLRWHHVINPYLQHEPHQG